MTKDEALKPELTCICGAVWEGDELVEAPRKREWAGLTGKDIDEVHSSVQGWGNTIDLIHAVERKLKEKNT